MRLEDFTRDGIIEYMMVKVEGATYTNHKADRGGETKWGVIKRTAEKYQHVWSQFNWDGDMRTLPKDLAKYIYIDMFWDKLALDVICQISPLLAERMFCIAVNRGTRVPARYLQRLLNVFNNEGKQYADIVVDGLIGPNGATVNALRSFINARGWEGLKNLIFAISGLQENGYIEISESDQTQEKFMFGWSERVTNAIEVIYRLIFEAEDNGKIHYLLGKG